ncbi:hypothetical protein [Malaciobacter canalis]|uniref:hypothetical protein n=1 Tax=Malaciobacter canalis TaxID=1912871 RepID=UPI0038509A3A
MKLLKLCSTVLALVVSLNAVEVKPFGDFNFGDSFTPMYKSICKIETIQSIKVKGTPKVKRDEFCSNKENAATVIAQYVNSRFTSAEKVKIKGFTNLLHPWAFYIEADTINIKGVDFSLTLEFDTPDDKHIIGSYLLTKDDTLAFNGELMPLQLISLTLTAKDQNMFNVHKEEIFNILWKKYGDLVKSSRDKKRSIENKRFYAQGSNKTSIKLGHNNIIYTSGGIYNLQAKAFNKYLKDISSKNSKNDASGDL